MHCRTPATPRTGEFTPLTTLIHRESNGRLRQAIARLSPQQAQAILLRLVEGLTYDDVAAALGCTNATARVHVQRGRANLRKELPDLVADRSGSEYLR
jgi:RNA polymerase sigma-70 factor (ECF subfamily)